MKKLFLVFFSSLLIISCSNESEKRKSKSEKTNSVQDSLKTESVMEWTVKENERKANEEKLEKEKAAEWQRKLVEREKAIKEKHLGFLHVDSLNGKPISFYIENPETNELVKSFYQGEFLPSDNDETFELLDILVEKNEVIYPFYFHCLNSICLLSDGALSEVMGEPCLKMVSNYPNYTFSFFVENSELFEDYTGMIGYELFFQKYGTSNIQISESEFLENLKENLELDNPEIKSLLDKFISGIEQVKKNMED